MSSKPKFRFPTVRYPITISTHSILRMKQRAGLKTKKKRKMFVKRASVKGLLFSQIPDIEDFKSFLCYYRRTIRNAKKKDKYSSVYFYKDYFLIISGLGALLTVIKIDSQFKGTYQKVYRELNRTNEQASK